MLAINQSVSGNLVLPEKNYCLRIAMARGTPLEFYVDFETVSDLDDGLFSDSSKGGQPMIS